MLCWGPVPSPCPKFACKWSMRLLTIATDVHGVSVTMFIQPCMEHEAGFYYSNLFIALDQAGQSIRGRECSYSGRTLNLSSFVVLLKSPLQTQLLCGDECFSHTSLTWSGSHSCCCEAASQVLASGEPLGGRFLQQDKSEPISVVSASSMVPLKKMLSVWFHSP